MQLLSESDVKSALSQIEDQYTQRSWLESGAVKGVTISADNQVTINLLLGYPAESFKDKLISHLTGQLRLKLAEITDMAVGELSIQIQLSWQVREHGIRPGLKALPGVKNIIAIASGKGGVGKSTTTVNLALALAAEGARVGILDADIYGPNQPQMLGADQTPEMNDGQKLQPVLQHHLQTMSIGYLVDTQAPMVWRGPMVSKALLQLLQDTAWEDLDYLLIDLPPGTGDIQLTLAQKVPVSAAIIVTTPQDVALLDANKALAMFNKVNVPVLGVVENMSGHVCPQCGLEQAIFGEGGAARLAATAEVVLLGQIPLDLSIRADVDAGVPTVVAAPESAITQHYRDIARQSAARLALQARHYAVKFGEIKVETQHA